MAQLTAEAQNDAASLGELETNGCAERWIRTLKEQCLWAELHDTVDELRQAVARFVDTYNTQWLIGRLGHHTPKEARATWSRREWLGMASPATA